MVSYEFSVLYTACHVTCVLSCCYVYIGPERSSEDADSSGDQQPTKPQVVSLWVVDVPTQPSCLHHFPRVSHILCFGCAHSSIKHMYVHCVFCCTASSIKYKICWSIIAIYGSTRYS